MPAILNAISKVKLPNEQTGRPLFDANALHYIGHTETTIVPHDASEGTATGATIEINDTNVTAVVNDFVTSGAENLNYVCVSYDASGEPTLGWELISEATAANALSGITVNGVANAAVTNHVAPVTLDATHSHVLVTEGTDPGTSDPDGHAAYLAKVAQNTLPDGTRAATQNSTDNSTMIATNEFVHSLVDGIAKPMIYIGGATIGAGGAITITDPADPADIMKGYTYKITSTTGYAGTDVAVGDTIIANQDTPGVSALTNWTIIPSGDDVDVTAIAVGTGMTVVDDETHSTSSLTKSGTIGLNMDSTASSGIPQGNRVFAVGVGAHPETGTNPLDGKLAVAVPAGALADVVNDVAANGDVVKTLTATATASQTTSENLIAFEMDTTDTEQLNLLYLVKTTDNKNVYSTAQ